jgi:hypothetical protein
LQLIDPARVQPAGVSNRAREYQRARLARFLDPEYLRDMRMIEGGEHPRLALEARQPVGVCGKQIGQDLDRDVALKPGVVRAIHFSHASGADSRNDLVCAQTRPRG